MSLNSTTTKVIYDGDGATAEFPVTFKFLQNAHVQAILQTATGDEIVWTEGTQYTLTGAGEEEGGTLAVITIPADHTPQPGELLVIRRAVPETQLTELPLGGTLPSTTIEQMVDLLTMMVQAHSEEIARSVLLKATSQASGIEIPDPEAAKFLRWDALGDNLENAEITGSGSIGIPVSIAQGGTNATTAASARSTLAVPGLATANSFSGENTFSGTLTMSGKPVELAEGAAVASAGTTDIWGGDDGNTLHVTGTTTITSFGTAPQAGAWRLVIFDGALILTHGASLILPAAGNITTAAGDSCLVYADTTTVMRVVFYHRAATPALRFATQTEMEAGSLTSVMVSPGIQHFHDSAVKFWAKWDGDTAGPITPTVDYNVVDITDNAEGDYTVNVDTNFSGAHWVAGMTVEFESAGNYARAYCIVNGGQAAGTLRVRTGTSVADNQIDPASMHAFGLGDQ